MSTTTKIIVLTEAIRLLNVKVGTIESIVIGINNEYESNNEPAPLPTESYKRRAWLLADLTRMLDQEKTALIEEQRANGHPVDEEGNDTREWCGNDIEAAHAEALEVDSMIDDALSAVGCYADNVNLNHVMIQNAVENIRNSLLSMERFPARFIVKMMVHVRNRAKVARDAAVERYAAMMARPFVNDPNNDLEIPF